MEAFCDASHQDIVQNDARSSIVCEPRNYHAADGTGEVTLEEVAAESMICDVESVRIIRMEVIVPCSTEYNGDAEIQIFIGDVSRPVARSLLRDVISMEGRPLNLIRTIGQPMRIVLTDPSGSARDLDYKVILVTAPA